MGILPLHSGVVARVMAGLDPAIQRMRRRYRNDVDHWDKSRGMTPNVARSIALASDRYGRDRRAMRVRCRTPDAATRVAHVACIARDQMHMHVHRAIGRRHCPILTPIL